MGRGTVRAVGRSREARSNGTRSTWSKDVLPPTPAHNENVGWSAPTLRVPRRQGRRRVRPIPSTTAILRCIRSVNVAKVPLTLVAVPALSRRRTSELDWEFGTGESRGWGNDGFGRAVLERFWRGRSARGHGSTTAPEGAPARPQAEGPTAPGPRAACRHLRRRHRGGGSHDDPRLRRGRHLHVHDPRLRRHGRDLLHGCEQLAEHRLLRRERCERDDRLSRLHHPQFRHVAQRRRRSDEHHQFPCLHPEHLRLGHHRALHPHLPADRQPHHLAARYLPGHLRRQPGNRRRNRHHIRHRHDHRLQHHPGLHRPRGGWHRHLHGTGVHQHLHGPMRERDPCLRPGAIPQLDHHRLRGTPSRRQPDLRHHHLEQSGVRPKHLRLGHH